MSPPDRTLQLWLPALAHFAPEHPLRAWLTRADRLAEGASGYLGGLGGWFAGVDAQVAAGALTRELIAGDAGNHLWLSADPAWVQPDMTGVRLLACGHMQLDQATAEALADTLRPVFDEAGMELLVSAPDHWHLRLPADTALPEIVAPEQALGEDLSQHLPAGEQGRRWRVLLNDVQVMLHQHPLHAARAAQGLPPVNSLWLWGGGRLPEPAASSLAGVVSDDLLLRALASRAGIAVQARTPETLASAPAGGLVDLQDLPATDLAASWWPLLESLLERRELLLHFASGERWRRKPRHRWRLWRGAGR